MARLVTGIRLTDSIDVIERRVVRAFARELDARVKKVAVDIQNDIANNIGKIFPTTPEYMSLTSGGDLARHFGIPQNEAIQKMDAIINTLANSVRVRYTKITVGAGNRLNGGITVYAFLEDFSDILALSESKVTTNKGQQLPWLEWLTIEGDKIIITNHEITYGPYPTSRAGGTIMRKTTTGTWKVPLQYSGTPDDNWITRAINTSNVYLENLIGGAIKHNIEKAI